VTIVAPTSAFSILALPVSHQDSSSEQSREAKTTDIPQIEAYPGGQLSTECVARGNNEDLPGMLNEPKMKPLAAFGLFAVTAMLVCYAFEKRNPWFILAFAVSCALGSIYGFLQGAWPFGLIEAVWAVVAARRWWVETVGRRS